MAKMRKQVELDEAFDACITLNLTPVKLGGYLIVFNSDFDLLLCGEPYVALMLFFNIDSGKFIARIWNETITVGTVATVEQLIEACRGFFIRGKPCVGWIENEPFEKKLPYLASYAPIQRMVSKACSKFIHDSQDSEVISCAECQKLSNLVAHHDLAVETSPNTYAGTAVKEEIDDACADIWEEGEDSDNDPDLKSGVEKIPTEEKTVLQEKPCKSKGEEVKLERSQDIGYIIGNEFETGAEREKFKVDMEEYKIDEDQVVNEDEKEETDEECKNRDPSSDDDYDPPNDDCDSPGSDDGQSPDPNLLKPRKARGRPPKEITKVVMPEVSNGISKCPFCDKLFKSSLKSTYITTTLKQHMETKHFWGRFKCSECSFCCSFAQELTDHMAREEHGENPLCPRCKTRFGPSDFVIHYQVCIQNFYKQTWKRNGNKWKAKNPEKYKKGISKKRMCEQCGKEVSAGFYKQHLEVHQRQQEGGGAAGSELYHYCDKCEKRYNHALGLKRHILAAHEGRVLTCPQCGEGFNTDRKLREHKLEEHSTDDKYQCKHCDYRAGNLTRLKVHTRKHEPPKFKCNFCDRMFKCPQAVTAHEREHTGERPFCCDICGSAFKSNDVLQNHLKCVHKVMKPGWKPLVKRHRKKESV